LNKTLVVAKEGDMPAIPHVSDMHAYASTRVFSGTRPLSAARAEQLQARFRQAPARHHWSVFDCIVAAMAAVAHPVRFSWH
jgi:hypothetical protein